MISQAGTHKNVAALVDIAAFAPDEGESVNGLIAGFPADSPQPPIVAPKDGFLHLDRERFHAAFAADVADDEAVFMADSQVPWGLEATATPVTQPAWRSKPSWYRLTSDDQMIPPSAQRTMSTRMGAKVVETRGSHAIYVSRPDVVADLITEAATAGPAG